MSLFQLIETEACSASDQQARAMLWIDLQDMLTMNLSRLQVSVLQGDRRTEKVGTGMFGYAVEHLLDVVHGIIKFILNHFHLGQREARTNTVWALS